MEGPEDIKGEIRRLDALIAEAEKITEYGESVVSPELAEAIDTHGDVWAAHKSLRERRERMIEMLGGNTEAQASEAL